MKKLMFILAVFQCYACQNTEKNTVSQSQATLYHNGIIITMEGDSPQMVEAIVESEGKITFTGNLTEAEKAFPDALQIDLQNKTLLPGFIDPHSHFGMVSNTMGQVDLNSPPVGSIAFIPEMMQKLKDYKSEHNIPDGKWIFGWGYDESQLKEKRHPNKNEIDKVLPGNPVYLQHTSGHMGVANTMALQKMNVTKSTPNPEGGNIDRFPNSSEPSGLVQETAMYPFVGNMLQILKPKQAEFFDQTQNYYAQNGITTAQDGMTDRNAIHFFQSQAEAGKLIIDLVALPGFSELEQNIADTSLVWRAYQNGFKLQGTKIIADGSPQGKTAYFTEPYLTPVPGCEQDCRGFPNISQEGLNNLFITAYKNDNQLFIHCNGDASIDMVIAAYEHACKELGQPLDKDRRTVAIHSQFVRTDQLAIYKKYKIIPSFFTNHAYFWGDAHVQNLGKDRAHFLSPIVTADSLGLMYTNHSDATVTPVNPLFTVWSAVNRVTRSGQVIGKEERATPYQALKAITANAAFQYYDENLKGTLTRGKLADIVILDKNPLEVPISEIREIKVMETIKEGKTIYKRD